MEWCWVLDIGLVAVLVLSAVVCAYKGFFNAVYKLCAFFLTIMIVSFVANPAAELVMESPAGVRIHDAVYQKLEYAVPKASENRLTEQEKEDGGDAPAIETNPMRMIGIPDYIAGDVIPKSINSIAQNTAYSVVKVLTCVVLFIAVRFLIFLIFALLGLVCKLPVLKQMNMFLGGVVGLLNGLIMVYVLCGAVMLCVGIKTDIAQMINNTYLFKYFYNNNIIMNMII